VSEQPDRYILASPELMAEWTARTIDGRLVTIDWGEPTGHEPDSDRYVYTPTFTASGPSLVHALSEAHAALGSFIWLGNNLHNSDTATFREMYRACLSDAVTAYNATLTEGETPAEVPA
jgi:hypothetical protein